MESKRVVIFPTRYDNRLRDEALSGIACTEHSIEQMAIRLNTLNRRDIMRELVAAAMPSLSLILGFCGTYPVEGACYALKTPRGIGVLAINHIKDIEVAGHLVTWISNEDANARKYQQISWQALPRRVRVSGVSITIDIPSGIKLYFPHELSPEWVRSVRIGH